MSVIKKILIFLLITVLFSPLIESKLFVDNPISPKEFYLLIVTSLILLIYFLFIIVNKKRIVLKLNEPDLILIIYFIYLLLRLVFTPHATFDDPKFMLSASMVLLYFIVKNVIEHKLIPVRYFIISIVCISLVVVLSGYSQLLGISENLLDNFKIGGPFGNPGMYGNYLASVFPIIAGTFLYSIKVKKWKRYSYLIGFLLILILMILLILKARTAWLSVIITIILFLVPIKDKYISLFGNKWNQRMLFIISGIALTLIFITYSYKLKKDSADGRLLTWKITCAIIHDYPLFGSGFNTFQVKHNDYQAHYFDEVQNSKNIISERYLADNIIHAFNDFLEITSELGIVGLIFFSSFIYIILKKPLVYEVSDELIIKILKISLISILICSLTSYPLSEVSLMLLFYLYCSILSSFNNNYLYQINISRRVFIYPIILFQAILIYIIYMQLILIAYNIEWKKTIELIAQNKKDLALTNYSKLYSKLKYSGLFLYNYGAELSTCERYNESLQILKFAELKINDADFYTYLGNTYEGLNDLENAEKSFKKASLIVPHLLYPKYRLVFVYKKRNKISEALRLAKEIIEQKPKIHNQLSIQLKNEMSDFFNNYKK